MRFGLCAGLEKIADAERLGFDYLEPPVSGIAAATEDEFESMRALASRAGIPCPAFNILFPASIALIGGTGDEEIARYLRGAFARVSKLGGRLVVFGSGRSRVRPEGMSYGAAFARLTEAARLIGKIAAENRLSVAVEPLNRSETNMICSMAEGAALAAAADMPNIGFLSDYYHVARDGDPIGDIVRLGGVCHTHIATREGRRYPAVEKGDEFRAFFKSLKATGYQGDMSVEGNTDDLDKDAPQALALLKRLWAEA